MLSTIFESEIYLGFLGESKLQEKSYEQSFLGGRPIFLRKPRADQLECTVCRKEKLTFICQIFCPLDGPQSYNRVLYVFYCEVLTYLGSVARGSFDASSSKQQKDKP